MAVENETAEQVVKMILQGSEVVLRISGEAAINVVKMIYAALKGDLTTKGKATLWEFLKSGKDQKIFQIPDEYLKAFNTASKKYGFPYVMLKDKNNKNGLMDIMVYATDASKVNRVIESLQLTVKKVETIKPEVSVEGKAELFKPLGMQLRVPFELIDDLQEETRNKRLLAEVKKLAVKMEHSGPQIVKPVELLCKENGHYELIAEDDLKSLLAMRIAGYKGAVAEISVPKVEGDEIEVRAGGVKESRERTDTPMEGTEPAPFEKAKDTPTKEEGQTVNPTMVRTIEDPVSGPNSGTLHQLGEEERSMVSDKGFIGKRSSVKKDLQKCKKIAESRETMKAIQKAARAMPITKPVSK